MITHKGDSEFALAVVRDDFNDGWKLQYVPHHNSQDNDDPDDDDDDEPYYGWCLICNHDTNGAFALQWCGTCEVEDTRFVLYLNNNNQLLLTDHTPDSLLPEHFVHNFSSPL